MSHEPRQNPDGEAAAANPHAREDVPYLLERSAALDAEREVLRGVAGVFGFRLIAENAVIRPASMSYVKPSELAGRVARRITELESRLAALAPTEGEIDE